LEMLLFFVDYLGWLLVFRSNLSTDFINGIHSFFNK
jgi:hypothetical protein